MLNHLRPAIVCFASLTLITGVIYPAIVTGIARLAFHEQATGSLIREHGQVIGSRLIAQPFSSPGHFWPRPSAAGYDGAAGGGSNLGPTNPALVAAVGTRLDVLRSADPAFTAAVPIDLLTASGSGLDPHITPAAARAQAARVARARRIPEADVTAAIDEHTEAPTLGVLGEARVNVLQLNLSLDHRLAAQPDSPFAHRDALGWRWRGFAADAK